MSELWASVWTTPQISHSLENIKRSIEDWINKQKYRKKKIIKKSQLIDFSSYFPLKTVPKLKCNKIYIKTSCQVSDTVDAWRQMFLLNFWWSPGESRKGFQTGRDWQLGWERNLTLSSLSQRRFCLDCEAWWVTPLEPWGYAMFWGNIWAASSSQVETLSWPELL